MQKNNLFQAPVVTKAFQGTTHQREILD